jgi:hypothetical protein
MAVCHDTRPAAAPIGPGHTAACHLYPGADPAHPGRAWEPAGRRLRLTEPPRTGALR